MNLVFQLAEDFPNLVFDLMGGVGLLLERLQIGEKIVVDKLDQIIAGQRVVVVERAVLIPWSRPAGPAVLFVEDVAVLFAGELSLHRPLGFQIVQIFQKQHPRGLLGVVELGGTACVLTQDIVDIFE